MLSYDDFKVDPGLLLEEKNKCSMVISTIQGDYGKGNIKKTKKIGLALK